MTSTKELLTLQWVRENEALPPGRCRDDGDGGLEIRGGKILQTFFSKVNLIVS